MYVNKTKSTWRGRYGNGNGKGSVVPLRMRRRGRNGFKRDTKRIGTSLRRDLSLNVKHERLHPETEFRYWDIAVGKYYPYKPRSLLIGKDAVSVWKHGFCCGRIRRADMADQHTFREWIGRQRRWDRNAMLTLVEEAISLGFHRSRHAT